MKLFIIATTVTAMFACSASSSSTEAADLHKNKMEGQIKIASVTNFEAVSPNLWRGGEPTEEGMRHLVEGGVSTIVDLRMDGSGAKRESSLAQRLGLKYIHIPLGYFAPSKESILRFFSVLAANKNGVTFVHCRQGADRTGTVVALYRVLVQKWHFQETYQEMRAHHFKPWLFTLKERVESTSSASYKPDPNLSEILSNCSVETISQTESETLDLNSAPKS